MREEFQQRRGYDLTAVPAGDDRAASSDSLEVSERFLWDLRRTISELVIENYAGHLHDWPTPRGMRFTVEAYGGPCDCIPYGGQADEPMGEFWTPGGGAIETCRGMASAGHVYGKRIIGAEAFTAADQERWREHPALAQGARRPGVLRGHQPLRLPPLRHAAVARRPARHDHGAVGPALRAHADLVGAVARVARVPGPLPVSCCGRGLFVADICYLQPEAPPQGFGDHDRARLRLGRVHRTEAVLTRMAVKDGRIVLPDGMSYRAARAARVADDDAAAAAQGQGTGRGRRDGARARGR